MSLKRKIVSLIVMASMLPQSVLANSKVEKHVKELDVHETVIKDKSVKSGLSTVRKLAKAEEKANLSHKDISLAIEILGERKTENETTLATLNQQETALQSELAALKKKTEQTKAQKEQEKKKEVVTATSQETSPAPSSPIVPPSSPTATYQYAYGVALSGGASEQVAIAFGKVASDKGVTVAEVDGWAQIVYRESRWQHTVSNASSGAYGLPQSLPASKMATHGTDWQTNPETQLRWMYDYMAGRYGSVAGALAFWNANHWY